LAARAPRVALLPLTAPCASPSAEIMLYKSVQFACIGAAAAYSPAMPASRMGSSQVARSSVVEMAKKSVSCAPFEFGTHV
jgi:hypothetical protein